MANDLQRFLDSIADRCKSSDGKEVEATIDNPPSPAFQRYQARLRLLEKRRKEELVRAEAAGDDADGLEGWRRVMRRFGRL